MFKKLIPYYLSRIALVLAFGLILFALGMKLWMLLVLCGLILVMFLLAPFSGRYAVHPELGATAMRRDERTQVINDKAARNAFVLCMLMLGGFAVYFGITGATCISSSFLFITLALGAFTYFLSDLWLRRSQK